jgi:hypothetical protein
MAQVFDFPVFNRAFSPTRCRFTIMPNSEMNISRLNNTQTITENPGEYWRVQYEFRKLDRASALTLRAFLHRLRGHMNKTRLSDTTYKSPRGTLSGLAQVDGNNQYGLELNIVANSPGETFLAGDRFVCGDQLFELVADAQTNTAKKATLQLANEIRQPLNNGQPIVVDPAGLHAICRWAEPSQIEQLSGDRRLYRDVTLDFMEAIP